MAFEHPHPAEKPEAGKENKKKRTKKQSLTHVPLPVHEKKPHKKVEAVPHVEKTDTKKDEKKDNDAEKNDHTTPTIEAVEPQGASTAHESEGSAKTAENYIKPDESDERVVLLHVDNTEGEVFISDRLRSDAASQHVASEQMDTEETHEEVDSAEVSEEPADKHPEEDDQPAVSASTAQHSSAASKKPHSLHTAAAPAAAATASSPFLSQWRQRSTPGGTGNTPPRNPNTAPINPGASPSPNVLPITSQPVPERLRTTSSERRHLLTGLIVGGLIEHIRHKRREKKMTKAHKTEVKELKSEHQSHQMEAKKKENASARKHTQLEKTIERLKKEVAQRPNETAPESSKGTKPETRVAAAAPSIEQAKRQFEEHTKKIIENRPDTQEEKVIPADHRIETSAWHAIEVDKKTGKAVDNPSFAYGEAFQQEQHQEQLRREIEAASLDSDEVRKKYAKAKKVDVPTVSYAHDGPPVSQKSSAKIRDDGMKLARQAASKFSGVQPIDIGLWFALALILLAIINLL